MAKYVPSGKKRGAPPVRTERISPLFTIFVQFYEWPLSMLNRKFGWGFNANYLSTILKGNLARPDDIQRVEEDLYKYAVELNYPGAGELNPRPPSKQYATEAPGQDTQKPADYSPKLHVTGWTPPEEIL